MENSSTTGGIAVRWFFGWRPGDTSRNLRVSLTKNLERARL